MRTTGTYISAVGHVGLIGWLLLGWGLSADPLEFDTMTVTAVSGDEFEALTNATRTPDPGEAEPDAPVQPEIDQTSRSPMSPRRQSRLRRQRMRRRHRPHHRHRLRLR